MRGSLLCRWRIAEVIAMVATKPAIPPIASRAVRTRLATEGPYLELVRIRTLMLAQWWTELLRNGSYLSLFLFGFWAARRHVLDLAEEHRVLLRRMWWGGLTLTLGGFAAQEALRPALAGGAAWVSVAFGIVWLISRGSSQSGGISVAAGDRAQAPTFGFNAEARKSPRMPIGAGGAVM